MATRDESNPEVGSTSVNVPREGTRGAPFPRLLARLGNRMVIGQFRRKGGARTQGGIDALVLESIGAKSGQVRRAVLGYVEEGPDSYLVIASAIGAARNPAWLHNLAKSPDATVEFGDGRRVDVRAETLEGPELAQAWQRLADDAPEYVKYRSKTDREIAIVRLRARERS